MMRRAVLFIVLGGAAQSCFASARLPDYSVTQIGSPGSDHFVFCSSNTCPEPSIKHLASPSPVGPTASTVPFPLPAVVRPVAESSPDRPTRRHRVHVRRVHSGRHAPAQPQCVDAGHNRGRPEHFAGR